MTNTANYNLPQWEASDRVKRSDFNGAMQSIDTALAALPKIVLGSFEGDGVANRVIPLEFAPKIMILMAPILTYHMIAILTADVFAYCAREDTTVEPAGSGSYSPYLDGAFLRMRHADWGNKSGKTSRYILIG